jgi:hypothetical protein
MQSTEFPFARNGPKATKIERHRNLRLNIVPGALIGLEVLLAPRRSPRFKSCRDAKTSQDFSESGLVFVIVVDVFAQRKPQEKPT